MRDVHYIRHVAQFVDSYDQKYWEGLTVDQIFQVYDDIRFLGCEIEEALEPLSQWPRPPYEQAVVDAATRIQDIITKKENT